MLHTCDMERLIAADVAHPESPKRTKQRRKGRIATIDPRPKRVQVSREIPLEQSMDEVDRLRRDQLAIFVGRRNAGSPQIAQGKKFIILKRIKESGPAKPRIAAETDIVPEELSELGLVWPALVPGARKFPRAPEKFCDGNGRDDGGGQHSHDRRCRGRLSRRERRHARTPQADPGASMIGRMSPRASARRQRVQGTPVAGDCSRPEQREQSMLNINGYRQPPIALQMQKGGGIRKK